MVYYPIFGTEQDVYLRDSVEPSKDIEGLHTFWARCLYGNQRFLDEARTKKAILPCTPLAIVKLVEAAGFFGQGERPLEGRSVCIFNRSEVVGRPLASMMAHDGAHVTSFGSDFAARAGGLGVTRERHDERGANTPWCLTSGIFGGGIKAASRAMNSIGLMTR